MAVRYFVPAALVLGGLVASCSQPSSTAANAEAPNVVDDAAETAAVTQIPAADEPVPVQPAETVVAEAETAEPAVAKGPASALTSLPLKRGYYVDAEVPCGQASRADLFLVTRTGVNLNCKFKQIEKVGGTAYQVTSECSDDGASWGQESAAYTSTETYEIPNDTRFTVTFDGGSKKSARHCEQSTLPDIWRDNDISDLVG